jgi:hypothetical protein
MAHEMLQIDMLGASTFTGRSQSKKKTKKKTKKKRKDMMADGLKFQLQFKKCITFAILNYTPHPKKSTKMNGLATCTIFRTLAFTTIVETNIEAGIMEPLFSIWKYSISILSSEAGYSD